MSPILCQKSKKNKEVKRRGTRNNLYSRYFDNERTKELYVPDTLIEQQEAKKNKKVKQMLKLPSNIKAKFLYWKTKKQKKTKELR